MLTKKYCYVCGDRKIVQRHHIVPRSENGTSMERNLINVCEECHNLIEGKAWLEVLELRSKYRHDRKKERQNKFYSKTKKRVWNFDKNESNSRGHVPPIPLKKLNKINEQNPNISTNPSCLGHYPEHDWRIKGRQIYCVRCGEVK